MKLKRNLVFVAAFFGLNSMAHSAAVDLTTGSVGYMVGSTWTHGIQAGYSLTSTPNSLAITDNGVLAEGQKDTFYMPSTLLPTSDYVATISVSMVTPALVQFNAHSVSQLYGDYYHGVNMNPWYVQDNLNGTTYNMISNKNYSAIFQIARVGDTLTGSYSTDGLLFTNVFTDTSASVLGNASFILSIYTGKDRYVNGSAVFSNFDVSPVPEPEAYAMLMAGLGLLGVVARRKQKHQATA